MSERGKRDTSKLLTDEEILRRAHRFVRSASDDEGDGGKRRTKRRSPAADDDAGDDPTSASWVKPAAKRYEAALFKEFAIVDLSRASEAILASAAAAEARAKRGGDASDDDDDAPTGAPPPIGLRWRTEAEVVSGKGEATCAERSCSSRSGEGLETLELPFAYREAGRTKAALVKCRLCPRHARVARWAASAARRERERAEEASSSSDDEEERRRDKRKRKERKRDKKKKKKSRH